MTLVELGLSRFVVLMPWGPPIRDHVLAALERGARRL